MAAGMPMPVSLTSMRTCGPLRATATSTAPPLSVNLMALRKMFCSTRFRLRGSQLASSVSPAWRCKATPFAADDGACLGNEEIVFEGAPLTQQNVADDDERVDRCGGERGDDRRLAGYARGEDRECRDGERRNGEPNAQENVERVAAAC